MSDDKKISVERVIDHLGPEAPLPPRFAEPDGRVKTSAAWLIDRAGFGRGIVTSLVRLEGRPVGVLANDPAHLGGAIDTDAADKAARFLQLCDAHRLDVLFLCDTPGFLVGPDAERTAQVRHFARLFVTAGFCGRLRLKARRLLLGIVELGETVRQLAPADEELEAVSDERVGIVAARER